MGLPAAVIKEIQNSLSEAVDEITVAGYLPVIICSAQVRPYFNRMIHNQFPMVSVISYTELPPDTDVEIVSSIKLLAEEII